MSNKNYANAYSNYSNYSNITNYTTQQQDRASQVVNLLNQCSIEDLERIGRKVVEIKKQREEEFRGEVYNLFCKGYEIKWSHLYFFKQEELLQAIMYLENKDGRFDDWQAVRNCLKMQKIVQNVHNQQNYSGFSELFPIKDIDDVVNRSQTIHIAAKAVMIKLENEQEYQQYLKVQKQKQENKQKNEKPIQEFMKDKYQKWFEKMLNGGLWNLCSNVELLEKQRESLCRNVENILSCRKKANGDFDLCKVAYILGCQTNNLIDVMTQFMDNGNAILQQIKGEQNNRNNYTPYYNNNYPQHHSHNGASSTNRGFSTNRGY